MPGSDYYRSAEAGVCEPLSNFSQQVPELGEAGGLRNKMLGPMAAMARLVSHAGFGSRWNEHKKIEFLKNVRLLTRGKGRVIRRGGKEMLNRLGLDRAMVEGFPPRRPP